MLFLTISDNCYDPWSRVQVEQVHKCFNKKGQKKKKKNCLHLLHPLSPGDTFTFSDVTRNVLFYRHAGLSNQDDAITFSVSDGISMATTVVQVAVLGAGDDGPQRDPAATLSLEVGEKSSTVIRLSHLAYTVSEESLSFNIFVLFTPLSAFSNVLWIPALNSVLLLR